jgi:hypothetical protein
MVDTKQRTVGSGSRERRGESSFFAARQNLFFVKVGEARCAGQLSLHAPAWRPPVCTEARALTERPRLLQASALCGVIYHLLIGSPLTLL